jgi:uncharacterized protein (DUF488 family)
MNKYLINILVFLGISLSVSAKLSDQEIYNLPESTIIKISNQLVGLYNSAKEDLKKTKNDLIDVQNKYDEAEIKLKQAELDRDKYKAEVISVAKQRDVVVICFAVLFSMWFGGFLGRFLYLAPPPWNLLAPFAGYGLGLALGYSLGRYILLKLSGFIP